MTTTDMSKAFAEARARGEVALLCEEIEALRTRAEQAEAERDRATFAARASGADLLRIGALCGMADDEYPLKAVERVVAEVARLRGEYARGLRAAADVARAHGGISAYYAIQKLAAEVEPAAEVKP